jgi:hypothetical protein
MSVPEILKHNDKHHANDFITKRWKDRKWLYVFALSEIKPNPKKQTYPKSDGNPKGHLRKNAKLALFTNRLGMNME